MKYALTTLAVIVGGCAAGSTATKSEDYEQQYGSRTDTPTIEKQLSPREEALQDLREQGAVIDDAVQCALVSHDYFDQEFNEIDQSRDAEYAALEKMLSMRGREKIVERYRSNDQRRLVTVKTDKAGNYVPVSTGAPAKAYAYTLINLWEAYGGTRDIFCVRASGPLDLVVTGTYDTLDAAVLAVRQAHDTDVEQAKQEMKERVQAVEERLRPQNEVTRRRFEEMREASEERVKHSRDGALDKVEIYQRKEEHRREERYQQQVTPTAPQSMPSKEQGPKTETPREEPLKGYKQVKEEIERRYEEDSDEIKRKYEEEKKKILGE